MSKYFVAKAPRGHTKQMVKQQLARDPYQTRTSLSPIVLTHPRTGKSAVLKEFIDEVDQGSRFAIECSDGLLAISRTFNSMVGYIFLVVGEGNWKEDGY